MPANPPAGAALRQAVQEGAKGGEVVRDRAMLALGPVAFKAQRSGWLEIHGELHDEEARRRHVARSIRTGDAHIPLGTPKCSRNANGAGIAADPTLTDAWSTPKR